MKIIKLLIFLINATSSIMHILFQFYLIAHNTVDTYSKFLLVENILIAFLFLLICVALLSTNYSKKAIQYNIAIWAFFTLCIAVLRPEHTTLDMVALSANQWLVLLCISIISITVNLIFLTRIKQITVQS